MLTLYRAQNVNLKKKIKCLFPGLVRYITSIFYGCRGNYATWSEAENKSSGYNSPNILEKVKESTLMVKNGIVPYERDSVVFDVEGIMLPGVKLKINLQDIRCNSSFFPLLSGLMWIAARNSGELNVLDFGGSLGSSYYQNKFFLNTLKKVNWNIVEQSSFVQEGKEHFEDDNLRFYYTIDDCLNENHIDVILLSGVLQYIEDPYKLLEQIISHRISYIIIDRTPFIKGSDRLTVQKVHPLIYKAKYPSWFFNESKFTKFFEKDYKLILEFDALDSSNILSEFKGFLYEIIRSSEF
jgi:putative methyltransferase (TIGR04325 family)